MATNGSADQGQVQGMIVKVRVQGDGTVSFDVVCHSSTRKIAHREHLLLPPKSKLQTFVQKGKLARVVYEKTGKERDRPIEITLIN